MRADCSDSLDNLDSLRRICKDPKIHTLTLPLISRFYGPAAYPALHPFPGCTSSNARQAIQAPGLLNCSVLGSVVQECQAAGKKVLLSVKGSGVGEVGGNADFGDPNVPKEPFGKAFAVVDDSGVGERGAEGAEYPREKREEADRPGRPIPLELLFGGPKATSTATPDSSLPVINSEDIEELIDATLNSSTISSSACPQGYPSRCNRPTPAFPNLFDEYHPPSAFALTLFSLFGEGHTERADLRPLGPDAPSGASPEKLNGTDWINPILTALQRPLGEEVVVDGFDVQVPKEWEGKYQDKKFKDLVRRLKELHQEAWEESGGVIGGSGDLGADGKGVVYEGWIGGSLKVRSVGLQVRAETKRVGWFEWDPLKLSE